MTMTATPTRQDEYTGPFSPEDFAPPGPPQVWALAPIPVMAPYLGLVCSVSSALVGGWLLLAPYAFNYRAGAAKLPRTALLDLTTGGATVAISGVVALLFGRSVVRRLRPVVPEPEPDPEPLPPPEPVPADEPAMDPDTGLRDLLAPLVAALAADLRNRQEVDH
jgi:hypothetical protein